jgi:hypothetical protein
METPIRRRLSAIPDSELDAVVADSPCVGLCERYYKCNGQDMIELMTMCVGLKSADGARYLGDVLVEPYNTMKFKKKVSPTQKHMVEEVKRRSRCSESPNPSCNHWNKERLQSWLSDNPVTQLEDVVFLLSEELKLHDSVLKSKGPGGNRGGFDGDGPGKSTAWTCNEPYLRLYHCIFAEETRDALMRLNQVMTRPELDARNSSLRPETFFEAVSRLFNSDKIFITDPVPDLYYTFADPIALDIDDMPGDTNPEECKKRFADARAKLIKIISKWELSGNGFGQRGIDDDDFGHLGRDELEAGDNRSNFLDSMTKEHILYFWHLADKNELLKNVMNVIADASSADSENYQTTSETTSSSSVGAARRKVNEAKAANDFRLQMGNAMATMSHTSMMTELREAEAQSMKYQELIITTDNERLKALYGKFAKREDKRIEEIQCTLDRMKRRRIADSHTDDEDE